MSGSVSILNESLDHILAWSSTVWEFGKDMGRVSEPKKASPYAELISVKSSRFRLDCYGKLLETITRM